MLATANANDESEFFALAMCANSKLFSFGSRLHCIRSAATVAFEEESKEERKGKKHFLFYSLYIRN